MTDGGAAQRALGSLLLPRPQRLRREEGTWALPSTLTVHGPGEVLSGVALRRSMDVLHAAQHAVARTNDGAAHVRLRLEPLGLDTALATEHARQAYALHVTRDGVTLSAPSVVGLEYALYTLAQLIELAPRGASGLELPCLRIEDWPDFAARGVMLDISRDKVPTLSTVQTLVDRLASWKVNQLQLYMEHTFAYVGHERVWRDASPFTAEEIRALDAHCAERHVELVPNQNSFGHMHRWLAHQPYRALAECPGGFEHPWNWSGEPYGLCATDPATLRFLEGLYDQLLPNFRSALFNVGLDEPLDLGHGRSRAACEARGAGRLYLDFLKAVHARVHDRGRTMAFWADTIVKYPELIAELPGDVIALEWGYEAAHPFAEHLALLSAAGAQCYVCPGTSSWNSLSGRTQNAIENAAGAARAGKAAGARGLLMTDWGDHGHLQPLCVSYLGFVLGAALSWNTTDAERPQDLDMPGLLDVHAFADRASGLGRVACDLGNAHLHAGSLRPNSSVLFWSLIKPERLFSPPGVTRETLERTLQYVAAVSAPLDRARPLGAESALSLEELGYARDLLRFACHLGVARSSLGTSAALADLPYSLRAELRADSGALVERHRSVWSARNRPGGLDDSARRLTDVLRALS